MKPTKLTELAQLLASASGPFSMVYQSGNRAEFWPKKTEASGWIRRPL